MSVLAVCLYLPLSTDICLSTYLYPCLSVYLTVALSVWLCTIIFVFCMLVLFIFSMHWFCIDENCKNFNCFLALSESNKIFHAVVLDSWNIRKYNRTMTSICIFGISINLPLPSSHSRHTLLQRVSSPTPAPVRIKPRQCANERGDPTQLTVLSSVSAVVTRLPSSELEFVNNSCLLAM